MFSVLINCQRGQFFLVPDFPSALKGLTHLKASLTSKDLDEEGFEYFVLLHVLCLQGPLLHSARVCIFPSPTFASCVLAGALLVALHIPQPTCIVTVDMCAPQWRDRKIKAFVQQTKPQSMKCVHWEKFLDHWPLMTTGQIQLGYKWTLVKGLIEPVLLGAAGLQSLLRSDEMTPWG